MPTVPFSATTWSVEAAPFVDVALSVAPVPFTEFDELAAIIAELAPPSLSVPNRICASSSSALSAVRGLTNVKLILIVSLRLHTW